MNIDSIIFDSDGTLWERNHLKNPVYVGDTQGDCDGARLAKIPFIYVDYGFGKVNEYDYIIKEVADLAKLF